MSYYLFQTFKIIEVVILFDRFICTVQERSADWSIESLLVRWNLASSIQYPSNFLKGTGINEVDLTGNHQIFVLTLWKK